MLNGEWWVHFYIQDGRFVTLVSQIFWVLLSICLHELAHGWAALHQGDDTPRRLNRMTMNPLVHMGGMSLLVFALIGFAWGAMPTDRSQYRNRRVGRVVVAAAGPAMNIALAIVALTAAAVWEQYAATMVSANLYENGLQFLMVGGWLNIVLVALNLLPIPPLDGSEILSGLSPAVDRMFQNPQAQMFGMFALLAVFITGVGSLFFVVASEVSNAYVTLLQVPLP